MYSIDFQTDIKQRMVLRIFSSYTISNSYLYCRMVNMDVEGGFLSPSSRAPLQKHESETSELLQSNLPLLFANGVPTSLESMTLVRV